MILSGLNPSIDKFNKDPSKGFTMVLLSFATSIDALAVGLTLALVNVDIWYPSVIIGLITSILSLIAIHIGLKIGITFGKRMEVIGGGLLIIIGIRILISHLLQ
jgi:putative Mn2+ efflux pump MntP